MVLYENQCSICDNSECKSYINEDKKYCSEQMISEESKGCYITTVICNVLGYTDQCYVLTQLRNFRNNVMQKDSKYFDTLLEYDVVGPVIAYDIQQDYLKTKNKDMWTRFYQLYLSKTADLISDEKYAEAVSKYQQMMMALEKYFGISEIDYTIYREYYNQSNGGHGKLKTMTNR